MKRLLFVALLVAVPVYAAEPQLDHAQGVSMEGQSLAFSPDAKRLAVVGSDGVKIYETAMGRVLETRAASSLETTAVAWSPDGKSLAAAGAAFGDKLRGEIWVWREGQARRHWMTGTGIIGPLAWSRDGKTLGSASGGDFQAQPLRGSALLWNAADGKLRHTLGNYVANGASIAFSGDGRKVAFSTADGTQNRVETTLCDAATGRVQKKWAAGSSPLLFDGNVPLLRNAPLARALRKGVEWRIEAINGADHMDYRFVARRVGSRRTLTSKDLGVGGGCAVFGGDYLATLMVDNYFPGSESSVAIWKIAGNPPRARLMHRLGKRTLSAQKLAVSRDGKTLAFATNRGTALLDSSLSKLRLLSPYEGQNLFSEVAPSLSVDGKILFDGRWLNVSAGKPLSLIADGKLGDFRFTNSMISPDGQMIAGGAGIGELAALKSGKPIQKFLVPGEKVGSTLALRYSRAFWSSDNLRLAVVGHGQREGQLFLFRRSGKFEREIALPKRDIEFKTVAFSADGKWLFTAGQVGDSELHLDFWNAVTGAHHSRVGGDLALAGKFAGEGVNEVAFSPDGGTVAVGGVFQRRGLTKPRLVFYDAASGKEAGEIPLPYLGKKVWGFLDGSRLAVLNGNGVEVWDFWKKVRERVVLTVPGSGEVELVGK